MNTAKSKHFYDVLEKAPTSNPFCGILKCVYALRFEVKRRLTDEEKNSAFKCLGIVSEDESIDKEVRAFCHNELGLIHSNMSALFENI